MLDFSAPPRASIAGFRTTRSPEPAAGGFVTDLGLVVHGYGGDFVAASREAIDRVVAGHGHLRDLVSQGWISVHAIEPAIAICWWRLPRLASPATRCFSRTVSATGGGQASAE